MLPMPENATPQPNEDLVRVFETEQEAEAMVVRGLLESAGIDAEFGESENAEVLPVGAVGVLVREEDAEKARQVLEDYRRSPEQENAEESEFDEAAMEAPSEDQSPGK
jgi:peptide subunit release factor 1 (eRF1)